jgi:hypothetical protein
VAKIRGQFFFSLFLKVVYSNLQGFKILEGLFTLETIDAREVYIELVEMLAPEKSQNGSSGTKCV